jgi:hypothetical protein
MVPDTYITQYTPLLAVVAAKDTLFMLGNHAALLREGERNVECSMMNGESLCGRERRGEFVWYV